MFFWVCVWLAGLSCSLSISFISPTFANNTKTKQIYTTINASINTFDGYANRELSLVNFTWNYSTISLYNQNTKILYNFDVVTALGESTSFIRDLAPGGLYNISWSTAPTNLSNPGFESNYSTCAFNWSSSAGCSGAVYDAYGVGRTGNFAMQFYGASSDVYVNQTVSVVSGQTYTLSGYYQCDTCGGGSGAEIYLLADGYCSSYHSLYSARTWSYDSCSFTATGGSVNIRLRYVSGGSAGRVAWDDLSLTQTSAASSSNPAFSQGRYNSGVVFDGINDFVETPQNISSSNAMTWTAWVKPYPYYTWVILGKMDHATLGNCPNH